MSKVSPMKNKRTINTNKKQNYSFLKNKAFEETTNSRKQSRRIKQEQRLEAWL